MNAITVNEIVKATAGKLIDGDGNAEVSGVSTDSRKTGVNDVFFPIVGEVHDAHKFIPQVVENGCRTIVLSEEEAAAGTDGCNVILVDDTLAALQALAKYYLGKLNVKVIAVTGSVGKTTTRDMVYYICSEKYKTGRTVGNFNNDIGVPLTIFSLDDTMEVAVLEEGMDHFGEIHRLVDITRPDVGIITNIGISHLENLGSRENIRKAKMEITDYFGPDNVLVINESCDLLNRSDIKGTYKVVTAGGDEGEDYHVCDICDLGEDGIKFTLKTLNKERQVVLAVPGAHNAINAALATAACMQIGVSLDQAVKGLANLRLTEKRLSLKEANGIKVIDDTYNAAPDSMKSAISTLVNTKGGRKVVILGGMNELGPDSVKYHEEVGRFAAESGVELIVGIEEKAKDIVKGAESCNKGRALWFESKEKLYPELNSLIEQGDVVLVKASRSLEMEKVVEKLLSE